MGERRDEMRNASIMDSDASSEPMHSPSIPNLEKIDCSESEATASVDWEPAPSLRSNSNLSLPKKVVAPSSVPMTRGRAKIQRELKEIGPYGTHRQRVAKVAYISLMVLFGIFLLNAVIVSLALWQCSRLQPEEINIRRVELYDLEKATARASISVDLPQRWFLYLFNVILHEPTVITVYAPDAIRNDEDKWNPLVVISIPRFSVGRSRTSINLSEIPIVYGSFPLPEVLDYFSDFNSPVPRRLSVRVEFEVETTSYWLPIRFKHAVEQTVELPPVDMSTQMADPAAMPFLDAIEFPREGLASETEELAINFHIGYPHQHIPEYLYVHIPQLFIDVGHFTDVRSSLTLTSSCIGRVIILPHLLSGANEASSSPATVQLLINEARREALAGLLGKVREGDFSWSLALGIDLQSAGDRLSYLQRRLAPLSYDLSIETLAKQFDIPLNHLSKRADDRLDGEDAAPALKAGLVEIDGRKNYPRAVFRFSIGNHYLQSLLGSLSIPKIKGSVPQLTFKAMVDKTGGPPIEIFNVDLVHLHSDSQLKFLLYTGVVDISTVVKAVNKVAHNKILASGKDDDDSFDYNAVFLHVAGERILDKLLRVFEVQFALAPGGGFTFRHGSRRPLKQLWLGGDFDANSGPEVGSLRVPERQKMRHGVKLDITSSTETIRAQGGIELHEESAVESPFVYVHWNAMDLSIFPEEPKFQHVELLRASITRGSMRMALEPTLAILQRFYRGAFDFELAIKHSDEVIDGVPALIAGWRHIATQFVQPEVFARIHMVGRMGNRKIDIPSCLPSRAQLFMANTDVPRWVTDVIKTRVKIAGFTDAVLQVLLELPRLGNCKSSKRYEHEVAVELQVALPALHANGCLYPKVKGREQISCVASVGLHPLIVGVELFDGEFCDIKTRLAKPNERVYQRKVAEYEATHDHLLHEHRERPAPKPPSPELFLEDDEGTLINYLPLSVAITDLKRGLQAADKLAGAKKLRYLKTSLGFSDRKALLLKKSSSLLDRLINGAGQAIPLVLPLHSRKKRPARPPLSKFYKGKPLKVHVDVHSRDRSTLKGRLICRLPRAVLPSTRKAKHAPDQSSLALLLAVQWGRTLISLRHRGSWFKARISQGQATFRLDENRVKLGRHSGIPFMRNIVINFALHTDARDFSSLTLRRILARLHDFSRHRAGDHISRHIMKGIPSKRLEFSIQALPFQADRHRHRRAGGMNTAKGHKGSMLRQHLRLSTVVEMAQRLMKHLKHRSGHKLDYQMIIRPRPHKHVRTYRLPCFIPSICEPKELRRPSPKKEFMMAELSLLNVLQPMMNLASLGLGLLLDKVNFRQHPKYLAVSVRVSRIRLAVAINDLDVLEVEVDPIHVTRVSKIIYPQDGRQHLSRKRRKHHDVQVIVAHLRLARRLQEFSNLLRPFNLDASMAINIDPVPRFVQRGHRVPVHYSYLNVALSTERVHGATMLSTLVALGMPETAVSPMISSLGKGAGVKINILRTSKDGMHMKISGVNIPNPLPFAAISLEHPVSASYVYKGIEFARVKMGRLTLVPGENLIKAHVMVSRSAFGKLRNHNPYIPELSEFLAGLALAQPLKVSAIIHIGRHFHMRTHLNFQKGVPAMGAFNPKNSYVDFRDAHEILRVGRKLPQAAWSAAKSVSKRLATDVGNMWGWTRDWLGGMYTWAKTKIFGDGRRVPQERQLPPDSRHLRRRDRDLNQSEGRRLFPRSEFEDLNEHTRIGPRRRTERRRELQYSDDERNAYRRSHRPDEHSDHEARSRRGGDEKVPQSEGLISKVLNGAYDFISKIFTVEPETGKGKPSKQISSDNEKKSKGGRPSGTPSRRKSSSSEESSQNWTTSNTRGPRDDFVVTKSTWQERERHGGGQKRHGDKSSRHYSERRGVAREKSQVEKRTRTRARDSEAGREESDERRHQRHHSRRSHKRRGSHERVEALDTDYQAPKRMRRSREKMSSTSESEYENVRTEKSPTFRKVTSKLKKSKVPAKINRHAKTERSVRQESRESSSERWEAVEVKRHYTEKSTRNHDKKSQEQRSGRDNMRDSEKVEESQSGEGEVKGRNSRSKRKGGRNGDRETIYERDGESRDEGEDAKSDEMYNSKSSDEDSSQKKYADEKRQSKEESSQESTNDGDYKLSGTGDAESDEDESEPGFLREDDRVSREPVLDKESITKELLLNDGKSRTRKQQKSKLKSVTRRIKSSKKKQGEREEKFNEDDPNGGRKISRSWQKRFKAARQATKTHKKIAKTDGSDSRSNSTPSDEVKFDYLLHRKDRRPKKKHLRHDGQMNSLFRRARKSSTSSSEDSSKHQNSSKRSRNSKGASRRRDTCVKDSADSGSSSWGNSLEKNGDLSHKSHREIEDNESSRDSGTSKRLHKRALSSSDSKEESTDNSSSTSTRSTSSHVSRKSWGQMWREFKNEGNQVYAHILKNFQHGYYHLAFNNEHDFVVMIAGMILNLEFLDKEGRFYSSAATALQAALGPLQGKPLARVQLAPKPCYKEGLDNAAFLRCVDRNVMRAPVILPPKFEMRKGDTVKAKSSLPNYQAIPQLVDQMVYRDGMCVAVRPSLVSTALARPHAPSRERPFLMHLLVTMDDMEQPNTPFSDPCHNSVKCIPQDRVLLFPSDRLIKQAATSLPDQRRNTSKSRASGNLENVATTRFFNRHTVHPRSSLLIKFKFRLSYVSRFVSLTAGPEQSGWSLIFKVGEIPKLRHRTAYGYHGVTNSVALIFDPRARALSIHRDGSLTPLMSKKASPTPPELSHDQLHQVLVQYRPADKILAVAISTVEAPEHRFLSVFPVDISELLTQDHDYNKMHVGMGMAAAGYAITSIKDFQLQVVLPDLRNTRIYYIDNFSVTAHKRGRFLLELRDSCNKIIPHSTVPVRIKLRPVERSSRHSKHHSHDPHDSLAAKPKRKSVSCKLKAYPQYGVYLVAYKAYQPGTYDVLVSYKIKPKHHEGEGSVEKGEWHRVKHYQVYVKNVW